MSESLSFLFAVLTGLLLGTIFFGGLWWTVNRGLASSQPAFWFLPSFLVRTGIVLFGFYWFAKEGWESMLLCLIGFTVARFLVILFTRSKVKPIELSSEVNHAP